MSKHFSRPLLPVATAVAVIAGFAFMAEAKAESVRTMCSTKYQAAKAANTLNGQTWNQFYKQCAAEAKATPETTTTTEPPPPKHVAPAPEKTANAPEPIGNAVFPTAVSPKYVKETPGKARMHTCLDQYKANKAANGNGGLNWIMKGGGYYSECNKRLKGEG
jgi:hypothetical protein